MFSLFQNRNKQVLEAVTRYHTNKSNKFPYKAKDLDKAKEWYIRNNARPDLLFILQMIAVKGQLEMSSAIEYL